MVGVAQLVEHKVVALVAAGSSPVAHPIFLIETADLAVLIFLRTVTAPVAQLDRASDFESVGRRFDSCRAHHKNSTLRNSWFVVACSCEFGVLSCISPELIMHFIKLKTKT